MIKLIKEEDKFTIPKMKLLRSNSILIENAGTSMGVVLKSLNDQVEDEESEIKEAELFSN